MPSMRWMNLKGDPADWQGSCTWVSHQCFSSEVMSGPPQVVILITRSHGFLAGQDFLSYRPSAKRSQISLRIKVSAQKITPQWLGKKATNWEIPRS